MPLPKENEVFTYGMYKTWPDDERWEIIEGVPYDMSPAPNTEHQRLSITISNELYNFLKNKKCKVFTAPFDVRLPESDEADDDITTVVQPDILVVCDNKKLDNEGCKGAPDFIIEILSPSTASKDMKEKFFLYEKHGVKEYWIVEPLGKFIMVYSLQEDAKYGRAVTYTKGDKIESGVLKDLIVDLDLVFTD
ncbi:hypothetical protein ES705_18918 [subsurface metagenome]